MKYFNLNPIHRIVCIVQTVTCLIRFELKKLKSIILKAFLDTTIDDKFYSIYTENQLNSARMSKNNSSIVKIGDFI